MSFEFGNPAYSQSAKGDHRVVVGVAGGNGYQQVPNTPQKTLSAQLADYTNRFKLEEDSVIVLRNVHKTYLLGIEGVPALRGVTVDIKRGEFIVILGKSGGGKTTMLNIMGTIDRPTRGDVYLCGHRVHSKTKDQDLANVRLHRLGFVFQTFNLLPSISAIDNVETPMVLAGKLSKAARRKKAKELLERVGMGGEQQRVTIARSLANDPDILLLDEPTGDLDTRNGEIVLKILNDLNRKSEGVTMVMVTHDVALKAFAHRVLHMVDGK
ncbi:abcH2, partial [Symbiodinium sp. KB8]